MENKTGKYLKYAIGEIMLVVIGILIALSINNWNDLQKRNSLETRVLKELKQNLNHDLEDINGNIDLHKKAIISSQLISGVIENNLPYHDSLDTHFSRIYIVPNFLETRTAYDNIKNAGTDLIRNDSLRDQIIGLYERKYVFLKTWVETENKHFIDDLHGFYRKEFSRLDFFGKSHPVDFEKLRKNQEYINYVNHQVSFCQYTLRHYYNTKEKAENIIEMINLEIDKAKK